MSVQQALRPGFGARLVAAMRVHGPVCPGIDPHPALLDAWQLPVTADGAREFGYRVVAAAAGQAAVVKPQVAFFERYGAAGYQALQDVLERARQAGLLVIADAKRADIGSSCEGYAEAWLDDASPLVADAVTAVPYLGYESLRPLLDRAVAGGRGVYVLAVTSNPEGRDVQLAVTADGRSVAAAVAAAAAQDNRRHTEGGAGGPGPVGLVVGVTSARTVAESGLDLGALGGTILAPGLGAQGGTSADLRALFGAVADRVVVAVGREVLRHGPDVTALRARIAHHNADTQAALHA